MTNGSLMKVKSIAECSLAIIGLGNQFPLFETGRFTQMLLYMFNIGSVVVY